MGTFKDSLKKWFYTEDTSPSVGDTTRIPLLDASGEPIGSRTLQDLQMVYPLLSNVFVAGISSNKTVVAPLSYSSLATVIANAIGVGVIEGGHALIVAKDQYSSLAWATSEVSGGTTAITTTDKALLDFSGKAKTSTIYTTLGSDAPAAKKCLEYYPSNVDSGHGLVGAGQWWLPSLGELAMIGSHWDAINYILRLIGGTELSGAFLSSTEYSAKYMWRFTGTQYGHGTSKTYRSSNTRPVTSISIY